MHHRIRGVHTCLIRSYPMKLLNLLSIYRLVMDGWSFGQNQWNFLLIVHPRNKYSHFCFPCSKGLVLITADNHTFPWCFATHHGAMEHTESCHTLVHNLVKSFSPWNNRNVGAFLAFLVKYCSFQYEEYISVRFLLKKLHVLPKLMFLKVDQYQLNRWAYNQCLWL